MVGWLVGRSAGRQAGMQAGGQVAGQMVGRQADGRVGRWAGRLADSQWAGMWACMQAGNMTWVPVCQLHHLYCPNRFQKSRSPLCVIHTPNDSTFASTLWCWSERVLPVTFVRYTPSILGGVHWCGWDSSSLGSEDVAKRVCPAKSSSGQYSQGVMTGATAAAVAGTK